MKIVFIAVAMFSILAFAGIYAQERGLRQIENSTVSVTTKTSDLLAMGPDPGGHTGATVTPETTKTGQPAVDSARQAASGNTTEHSGPPINHARESEEYSGAKPKDRRPSKR